MILGEVSARFSCAAADSTFDKRVKLMATVVSSTESLLRLWSSRPRSPLALTPPVLQQMGRHPKSQNSLTNRACRGPDLPEYGPPADSTSRVGRAATSEHPQARLAFGEAVCMGHLNMYDPLATLLRQQMAQMAELGVLLQTRRWSHASGCVVDLCVSRRGRLPWKSRGWLRPPPYGRQSSRVR